MSAADPPATDPRVVADQATQVANGWSPVGAPPSWALTAAQFRVLAADPELLTLAAAIEPDRLPALLFSAAATALVRRLQPEPLWDSFPRRGEAQPRLAATFAEDYRTFCLQHREELIELCAAHRYQMNEVGRCAGVLAALAPAFDSGREIVLVDIGTGAGLGLQLDRYRYRFHGAGGELSWGGESPVVIETEVRGAQPVPRPGAVPPRVIERVGIDIEPIDVATPEVRTWLAACLPQEIGALTRFETAVEVALAEPARRLRGDALTVLPGVLAGVPETALVCLLDTYVHVFFAPDQLARFHALVDEAGRRRDLEWISVDPLIPLGEHARESVLGVPVPAALVERNRRDGVFGLIGRVAYRGGERSAALLGLAHPGAAWVQWLGASA